MKKTLTLLFLLVGILSTEAQSYIGFLTDNYSGVHSVITNPANIVDSRFKTDINLFGVSAFVTNDYYAAKFGDAIKSDYDFEDDAKTFASSLFLHVLEHFMQLIISMENP